MAKKEDYLAMALSASQKAGSSQLDNVREQHERSAAVWFELARSEQARAKRRDELVLATARRLADNALVKDEGAPQS